MFLKGFLDFLNMKIRFKKMLQGQEHMWNSWCVLFILGPREVKIPLNLPVSAALKQIPTQVLEVLLLLKAAKRNSAPAGKRLS